MGKGSKPGTRTVILTAHITANMPINPIAHQPVLVRGFTKKRLETVCMVHLLHKWN